MEIFGIELTRKKENKETEVDFKSINDAVKVIQSRQIGSLEIDNYSGSYAGNSRKFWQMAGNLLKYKENGFIQNVVNSLADDATREWFTIDANFDDAEKTNKLNELIQARYKDFSFKKKLRDAIKFSRIYREGSGLYYGVISAGSVADNKKSETIDPNAISEISFINVLESPDLFTFTFVNSYNPSARDYGIPTFQISGNQIDNTRVSWLINELDIVSQCGISVVEKIESAIVAQESGLYGAGHILQRVGAVILKSPNMSLSLNTKDAISKLVLLVKSKLKSDGAMAIQDGDSVETLKHSFTGIHEVYDFVMDNLAGLANVPKDIIIGKQRGGIINVGAGDTDLINYYTSVEAYQENRLANEIRKFTDMVLMEKSNSKIQALTGGELVNYEINFNSLWSMTDKETADIRKTNAESDKIDAEIGKSSGRELREMDPYYLGRDSMADPRPAGGLV